MNQASKNQPASQWWWLSFADETGKIGSRSLGIAIVQGRDDLSAVAMSHELGINPGGSILLASIAANRLPAPENRNRLLSPADARELAAAMNTRAFATLAHSEDRNRPDTAQAGLECDENLLRLARRLLSRNQRAEVWIGARLVGRVSPDLAGDEPESDGCFPPPLEAH